jgi:uncharacterized protein YjbJ (UPF0337 family)
MDANTDHLKGRAKEAIGDLTDNEKLKREGQTDRKVGKAKELIDDVGEKAKALVDGITDRVRKK